MVDVNSLTKRIKLSDVSIADIAEELGLTRQALYYKLNHKAEWTYRQAIILQRLLNLNNQEMLQLFCGEEE